MFLNPTVTAFKEYFFRDFPYGDDPSVNVIDQDIAKAYGQTNVNINPELFADQANYTIGYLLLSAHFLVVDLRMSSQGLSGTYAFLETSKSVGSVAQSFGIPDSILDNPYYSSLCTTGYGAKYLSLVYPQLSGQIWISYGRTLP